MTGSQDTATTENVKLCECGCGEPAPIATITNNRNGVRKGDPLRFVCGHSHRGQRHPAKLREPFIGPSLPGTRNIPLSHDMSAVVDESDYELLACYRWRFVPRGYGYASRREAASVGERREILMHRQILNAPAGMEVDHRDRNGLNNRRDNLRLCTHARNMQNKANYRTSESPYKGVSRHQNGWRARITVDGKTRSLGTFDSPEEAARAYSAAARELFGEFAVLNAVEVNHAE